MPTLSELKEETNKFFSRHWDKQSSSPSPEWSEPWEFFHTLPNNELGGCYAFAKDEEVKYIGVALNRGIEGYENHSLGNRIKNYWSVHMKVPKVDGKTTYMPTGNLQTEGITSIYTIGLPEVQNYLALALELYLIRKLKPKMNKTYNSSEVEMMIHS
jgi:hypothetical protein